MGTERCSRSRSPSSAPNTARPAAEASAADASVAAEASPPEAAAPNAWRKGWVWNTRKDFKGWKHLAGNRDERRSAPAKACRAEKRAGRAARGNEESYAQHSEDWEIGGGTGPRRRLGVNGKRTQRRTSSEWRKQRKKTMPGAMLRHDPARPIATPPRTLPQGVRIGPERRPRKLCRSSPLPEALR